eukprot:GSChrysophyteH1.ASY1.ANO1.1791.1 assembled CDS
MSQFTVDDSAFKREVHLFVNGKELFVSNADPRWTLLSFLRDGGCGACTPTLRHVSANACLTPLCACDGAAVTTIEGIGGMKQGLHPVQERLANMHGSQCGFCTPGIVMSLYTQLRQYPNSTPHELEECMDGNLCRCTGYRPIIDAARSLSNNKTFISGADIAGGCCKGTGGEACALKNLPSLEEAMHAKGWTEPIFPPALRTRKPREMLISKDGVSWYQPTTLSSLVSLKAQFPQARIIVGNTEVGIETKFKNFEYPTLINPSRVKELKSITLDEAGLTVGAAVTINRLSAYIGELLKGSDIPNHKLRGLAAIKAQFSWFASNQIRNMACIGGNICTASPISDLNPMLIACGAIARNASSKDGKEVTREVALSDFFLAYRKVNLQPEEILMNIFIPFTEDTEFVIPLKQARRREDDISIVTGGFRVALSAPKDNTCAAAKGMTWNASSFTSLYDTLRDELTLPENVPGGQPEYRTTLAVSFMFRSFLKVTEELHTNEKSGNEGWLTKDKPLSRSEQNYHISSGNIQKSRPKVHEPSPESKREPVGQPVKHKSADHQVTGAATYTNDIILPATALHACMVTSTKAHARLLGVDISEAEKCPGFHSYITRKDVTGHNMIGAVIKDEEIFAEETVRYSHEQAQYAAKKVKVDYEELPAASDTVVQGTGKVGSQEHFYLETNAAIAVPMEEGQMEITASTQNPTKTQAEVAERHAFQFDYKAGCKKDGRLTFLDAKLYSNAGWSLDLSQAVMDRALFHSDNVYQWPNQRVQGFVCKTNQPSHTAFRGFGGPQGMMLTEMVMAHLSKDSGIDLDTLKQMNFYKHGEFTHFGQTIEYFNVPEMWTQVQSSADIAARKAAIAKYNSENKWKKRGMATIPTKFGINFTYKTMNQGGALVHVYMDGTTNTTTVANSSPTAASASTDLYGMAKELTGEGASWNDEIERCGYDWDMETGPGVACAEVEVDCLTGDSHLVRTDIVMDIGKSINPALDVGQIEGAFVQGYGWCTMEDMAWGDSQHKWIRPGQLFTKGPGTYKIPAFNDVPRDFRVHLFDRENKFAVHSSKAERSFNDYFVLQAPATSERIRMACSDEFTARCMLPSSGNHAQFQAKGSW